MEKSVFARFARHFEIMYGDRWATFMGGRLDGPSSFSEHSGSMEFPWLEVIEPGRHGPTKAHCLRTNQRAERRDQVTLSLYGRLFFCRT